jgi:mRNA interferase MazF
MNVYEKKIRLKAILNMCKGEETIIRFLEYCAIDWMFFRHILDTKNSNFDLSNIDIQKIIANADKSINKKKLENDLFSLVETKDKSLDICKGQLYWVDFGDDIIGSEQGGERPALVIQNDIGNKYSPTIIVIAVTSKINKASNLPVHVLVEKICDTGLDRDSVVLTEQVRTIDKRRVKRYIGECPFYLMRQIEKAVKISFGMLNEVDIPDFVDQFSDKLNFSDKFRVTLAKELKIYLETKNIDFIENVDDYITSLRRKIKIEFVNKKSEYQSKVPVYA